MKNQIGQPATTLPVCLKSFGSATNPKAGFCSSLVQVSACWWSPARQFVDNLIDNALKYGRQREGRIVIGAQKRDACIVVTVQDDGSGIDEADRDRIFVSGVRLSGERRRHVRSSRGLGLRFARWRSRPWADASGLSPTSPSARCFVAACQRPEALPQAWVKKNAHRSGRFWRSSCVVQTIRALWAAPPLVESLKYSASSCQATSSPSTM